MYCSRIGSGRHGSQMSCTLRNMTTTTITTTPTTKKTIVLTLLNAITNCNSYISGLDSALKLFSPRNTQASDVTRYDLIFTNTSGAIRLVELFNVETLTTGATFWWTQLVELNDERGLGWYIVTAIQAKCDQGNSYNSEEGDLSQTPIFSPPPKYSPRLLHWAGAWIMHSVRRW